MSEIFTLYIDAVLDDNATGFEVAATPFQENVSNRDLDKIVNNINKPDFSNDARSILQCDYCPAAARLKAGEKSKLTISAIRNKNKFGISINVNCKVMEAIYALNMINEALCIDEGLGVEIPIVSEKLL